MRGKGSPEPQVLERGSEDRLLLDDFCMGIELTFDCVLSHPESIQGRVSQVT